MNSKSMAGWIGFAGILLVIIGGIDFFQGLIALLEDDYYVPTQSGFLVFDLTGWGLAQLLTGILSVCAGYGALRGLTWARMVGIVLSGLSMIMQFAFIPHYPIWSMLIIALDVLVIWALLTYRAQEARR